ncbi:signal peptidase II [Blautia sp. HCP3S3_G3]|uniref:signal peptidase II n=1 Tax=Blautia sp. HCP3S3_G3 TaxID=3438913 RepID=UPI003F8A6712
MMKREKPLSAGICALTGILSVLLLTFLDQYTKYLAQRFLADRSSHVLIQGVLELKYLENTGIAFGLLEGKRVLFLVICILFFFLGVYLFIKIPKETYFIPLFLILFLMLSGAAGNFIDRVWRGYVVDFIYFSLIDFPVFNFADIYVVCGSMLLVLFVCLKYKEEDFAFLHRHSDC